MTDMKMPSGGGHITEAHRKVVDDVIEQLTKSTVDDFPSLMTMLDWIVGSLIVANCQKSVLNAVQITETHHAHLRKFLVVAWVRGLIDFHDKEKPK